MTIRRVEKIDYFAATDIRTFVGDVAIDTLEEEQARGFPREPGAFVTLVDNREKTNPHDVYGVKPFGKIEYQVKTNLAEIAIFVLDNLIKASPVGRGMAADRTGRYHNRHKVLFNGVLVGDMQLEQVINDPTLSRGEQDEIVIVNTQPYAMKIERGLSAQTPKGVYKRVFNMTRRRYGKVAFISQRMLTADKIPGVAKREVTKRIKTRGNQPFQVQAGYPAIRIRRGRGVMI